MVTPVLAFFQPHPTYDSLTYDIPGRYQISRFLPCDGLLEALQAPFPPFTEWFEELNNDFVAKHWAIHIVILRQALRTTSVYTISQTTS